MCVCTSVLVSPWLPFFPSSTWFPKLSNNILHSTLQWTKCFCLTARYLNSTILLSCDLGLTPCYKWGYWEGKKTPSQGGKASVKSKTTGQKWSHISKLRLNHSLSALPNMEADTHRDRLISTSYVLCLVDPCHSRKKSNHAATNWAQLPCSSSLLPASLSFCTLLRAPWCH